MDLNGGMVPVAALPEFSDGATLRQPLLFLEAEPPRSKMGRTNAQQDAYFKKMEDNQQLISTYVPLLDGSAVDSEAAVQP